MIAGVIGWPVEHSLSPKIHSAAAKAVGVDLSYTAVPVRPGETGAALTEMRLKHIRGYSVTMPHKEAVLSDLDELTEQAVALGAVGVAGLALTVTILDSVSELWTTAWGRLLIAKVLAVAVAMAAGAFNHFVLVPELQAISAHDDARPSFLRTLKIEVAALGVALIVTAVLVAAAS